MKVWLRGEADILADAPSRAPWESKLMENLPLADLPLRESIQEMYRQPVDFEADVFATVKKRGLSPTWSPIEGPSGSASLLAWGSDRPQTSGTRRNSEGVVMKTKEEGVFL